MKTAVEKDMGVGWIANSRCFAMIAHCLFDPDFCNVAERLIQACPPHLAALLRFALATGLRASEITGLEWNRVDLARHTAWLNQTKNGTSRGLPLNVDAVAILQEQLGQHPDFCFTYFGKPIRGMSPTPLGIPH